MTKFPIRFYREYFHSPFFFSLLPSPLFNPFYQTHPTQFSIKYFQLDYSLTYLFFFFFLSNLTERFERSISRQQRRMDYEKSITHEGKKKAHEWCVNAISVDKYRFISKIQLYIYIFNLFSYTNNIAIRCVVYRQPGHRGSNSTNDK